MFEYKFYTDKKGRKVVLCLTKCNGKTIRGKAICHPDDKYDEYRGKQLAYLRCESEYLCRRVKDIYKYRQYLAQEMEKLQNKCVKAENLLNDTCERYADIVKQDAALEKEVSENNED